ncbi:hypothetical protein GCM10008956_36640 [Deinococcus arenae]|uniref:GIY-YIG nuclease family protein n=2 Tax=Deinococcus TaxID=1298 RepID=A0A8H9GSI2_9DEIO|nr:GIY-YIG nuclease family protein [Deinococcus arenae]AWT34862.1 hypothetical protein DM785_04260 [Deinococcus actinosclerus]GGM57653.1 hypothetical protein GCM10008956_36640 [Deinococcus arenae]
MKHTPRPGIYRVRHLASGRSLLGGSVDAPAYLNRVRFELQLGTHRTPALQRDWTQDGPDAFTFEVLDDLKPDLAGRVSPDDLKELLALWQEKLNRSPQQTY